MKKSPAGWARPRVQIQSEALKSNSLHCRILDSLDNTCLEYGIPVKIVIILFLQYLAV